MSKQYNGERRVIAAIGARSIGCPQLKINKPQSLPHTQESIQEPNVKATT